MWEVDANDPGLQVTQDAQILDRSKSVNQAARVRRSKRVDASAWLRHEVDRERH